MNNLLWKIFIKNYKSVTSLWEKEVKQNTLWKMIILKDNITTKHIKYKHKNTGTSGKPIHISGLQCFNSSRKCWKTVSSKPSFGLSVEIWSQFSSLVCVNYGDISML